MEIFKANDLKEDFVKFLNKKIEEDEYESYRYQYLLEKDFSKFLLVVEKNEIVDIISFDKEFGRVIYYPFFLFEDENKVLDALRIFDERAIINIDSFHEELIFYRMNLRSSINWDKTYTTRTGSYFCANESDINLIRDFIEDKFFPSNLDNSNISFKIVESDEFKDLFRNKEGYYDEWVDTYNHYNLIGFHYLQPDDIFQNQKMLLAFIDNILVGVIKYGLYDENQKYERIGLNYIDVNEAYRNKGIAKKLILELSKELKDNIPLVLTDESDMGHFCHMANNFKKTPFSCLVYTRKEWEKFWLG